MKTAQASQPQGAKQATKFRQSLRNVWDAFKEVMEDASNPSKNFLWDAKPPKPSRRYAVDDELIGAAYSQDAQKVRRLFKRGLLRARPDPNAEDVLGKTALHWAAAMGNTEIVKMLHSEGADLHAKDKRGNTALSIAREQGKTDMIKLLESLGAKD